MRAPRIASATVAFSTIMLLAAGCGSSSNSSGGGSATTAAAAPATTAASPTATTAGGSGPVALVAENVSFSTDKLSFKAGEKVIVTVENKDGIEHNFTFEAAKVNTDVEGGKTAKATFTVPAPGTYNFHCEYHPTVMKGTVTVTG
jgi:plastocyanin